MPPGALAVQGPHIQKVDIEKPERQMTPSEAHTLWKSAKEQYDLAVKTGKKDDEAVWKKHMDEMQQRAFSPQQQPAAARATDKTVQSYYYKP